MLPLPTEECRAVDDAEIAELLRSGRPIVITTHVNPDGDALGSALAVRDVVVRLGGEARVVLDGPRPATYDFLPDVDVIEPPSALEGAPPGILIAVDCASADRFGAVGDHVGPATLVVNIDHHATNTQFAHWNRVDPDAAATGEVLVALLDGQGLEISTDAALDLYVAILTDTGRFSYSNTRPASLRAGARLLETGVDPDVASRPFRSVPVRSMQLNTLLFAALRWSADRRIAIGVLTRAMCEEAGVELKDANDMVDLPASLEGVELASLVRETGDAGSSKVSLRSRGDRSVADLAGQEGGGGHAKAAGFTFHGDVETAVTYVTAKLEELLA